MEYPRKLNQKKTFFLLWGLCIIGAWSLLPYIFYTGIVPSSISILKLFSISTVQAALFFGFVCWLSYKILPKTDLQPFRFENSLKRVIYPGVISGILVGLVLFLSEKTLFKSSLLTGVHPPIWVGALGSIYGAINEEVLVRLFLFTLFYLILRKAFKLSKIGHAERPFALWTANILAAVLFGMGHLPAAFKLTSPSAFEIFRVLFLNGIAGLVFGWLYWSRGLWTAICAHFVADLMIHVLLV